MTDFLTTFITNMLKRNSQTRWTVLGGDGRVLDCGDSNVNHVGQSINLIPPAVGNRNVLSILDARAKNPGSPEVVTIDLSVTVAPPGVPDGVVVLPQAQIVWGSGGALHTAIVDVLKGTQLTVAASLIRIDGIYFSPLGGPPTTNIRMNASLSYGSRASNSHGPSFTDIRNLPLGGSANVLIPDFAQDVTVYSERGSVSDDVPEDLLILFESVDAPTLPGTTFGSILQNEGAAPNSVFPQAYPIPGFARSLKIINRGVGANPITVISRFGLAL